MINENYYDASLYIDLNAIRKNYCIVRSQLDSMTECAAVVKADSYGLGALRITEALIQENCKKFFTVNINEAIILREKFQDPAIKFYVLNGLQAGMEADFEHFNLIPVVNDIYQLDLWNHYSLKINKKLPCVIHIDTGMTRLGFTRKYAFQVYENLSNYHFLNIEYVMSHLACADEPEHYLNTRQLSRFSEIKKYLPTTKLSLCNSAGIYLGKKFHFELVRPGCSLYGINPFPSINLELHSVVRLTAKIIQIRAIEGDRTVGYGATREVKEGQVVITVGLGYADGFFRSLGDNFACYIGNYRCPLIGRVSMDLITFDASHIPNYRLQPGQEVEILGHNLSVNYMASCAGTIGYEILTNLGHRFKRVYINGN